MSDETEDDRMLTASEAADYLGISQSWFHRRIKALLTPNHVPGYDWSFYSQSELEPIKQTRRTRTKKK